MYKIFSQNDTYVLPNGISYTGKEMLDSGHYSFLFDGVSIVDVSNGILTAICAPDDLRLEYGIDSEDANEIATQADAARMSMARSKVQSSVIQSSINRAAQIAALSFTDEQAVEVPDLYPEFEFNHEYKQNDRFQYGGTLYKVNQNHTSQEQWVPGETGTESLYTNLMLDESGYQIWKQPTGAHDAYNTGDIMRYPDKNGQLYKSLIDGNVYSLDVYPAGWEKYTEE